MVETTPPAGVSSGEYGKVRYLQQRKIGAGGILDIGLEVVAELSVAVRPPNEGCMPSALDASGYLPVKLKVFEDSGINGIAASTVEAESDPSRLAGAAGNLVTLSLAPGLVDLYIDPTLASNALDPESLATDDCDLAPILARGQSVAAGRVLLEHRLSVADHLNVDVQAPLVQDGSSALEGWAIDMVDPLGGRRLSSRIVLGTPTVDTTGQAHHQLRLAYHAVLGNEAERLAGTELFRLTPPVGVLAPAYYVARSGMDLFDAGDVVLSQVDGIPSPVIVNGLVESEADGSPLRADVTAILNPGDMASAGALAAFRVTTSTDDEGRFELELVAGNYQVIAVPTQGARLGSRSVEWTVAPSPSVQAGRLIRIGPIATLTGVVLSEATGEPLADATLSAVPSSFGQRPTFLDELLGHGAPIGVRSQMVVADGLGAFELPVDSGRYDIAVRPSDDTGYAWAIRPSTVVVAGVKGLPNIQVRNPVAYSGTVTVPGQSVDAPRVALPGALLRFYALFDENGQLVNGSVPMVSAVQIGEARADAVGMYQLLLPDQLD